MSKDPEVVLKGLVERAKGGDRVAYGNIFRLCYKDMYDYVYRRVGNVSDAEDISMQVFVQGLQAIGSYQERGLSVKAWLFRIAHNAVVDFLRRRKAPLEDLDQIAETKVLSRAEDGCDIEERVAFMESMGQLYKEIASLPAAQSEVLILRFIEDMNVAETASILGKKGSTVRALQFKGIRNLRLKLGEADTAAEAQRSAAGSNDHDL